MKQKLPTLLLSAALATGLLAGCGTPAASQSAASVAESAPESAASEAVSSEAVSTAVASAAEVPVATDAPASPSDGTEGATAMALLGDAVEENTYLGVPDFLTPDQQELFKAAAALYTGIGGCSRGYKPDYNTSVAQPFSTFERTYYLETAFADYAAFDAAMHAVFTDDFCSSDDVTTELIDVDGKLYAGEGDRGSNIFYLETSYEPVSQDDTTIVFNMVGHYNEKAYEETLDEADNYTEEYPLTMTMTENGWRFDGFALPY